jgi:hypothetical protein
LILHGSIENGTKIKDNNRSTGRGTIRFKFYNEMDALYPPGPEGVFFI